MSLEEPGTSEVVGELQPCRGKEEFQPQLIDEAHEFIKESTSSQLWIGLDWIGQLIYLGEAFSQWLLH